MKWIGQHIYDLVARFRNGVYIEGDLTVNGDNITFESATNVKPVVEIKSTTNSGKGSTLQFTSDKGGAGADGDFIGKIDFTSDNTAQEQTEFARILTKVSEADDTDEAGYMGLFVAASTGSLSGLHAGLVLEGEHATHGEVDVTIANGVASTTTVSGDLTVIGDVVMMANLPTSDPSNAGQLWNDSNTLKISAG